MFQFPGFAPFENGDGLAPDGLPHSAIRGSLRVCHSPRLIAAYHGLHRLRVPRHPPHAFARLTTKTRLARAMSSILCYYNFIDRVTAPRAIEPRRNAFLIDEDSLPTIYLDFDYQTAVQRSRRHFDATLESARLNR